MSRGTAHEERPGAVKCVVWDLDNTIWEGVLLEGGADRLRGGVQEVLELLDSRGIMHAIASRNDRGQAVERLRAFGILDYFVEAEIGWDAKSQSVRRIAERLNIGEDTLLFVDDDPFELDEVAFGCSAVRCRSADDIRVIASLPEVASVVVTRDAARRRSLYQDEQRRTADETSFTGPREDFLAELGLVLTVRPAAAADLERARELTVRTNQLNTSGRTYSATQLEHLISSTSHRVLVCDLVDRYGEYGTVGLAVIETATDRWCLRVFLMSCRVAARGAGTACLRHLMALASEAGQRLQAEYVPNERNRQILVMLRFHGFVRVSDDGTAMILEAPREAPSPVRYVHVKSV